MELFDFTYIAISTNYSNSEIKVISNKRRLEPQENFHDTINHLQPSYYFIVRHIGNLNILRTFSINR